MRAMASDATVDLAVHVVRTDAHVHGAVHGPSSAAERFDGWLDLTAAIARALDAAATSNSSPEEER
jgi:hypothetical protein